MIQIPSVTRLGFICFFILTNIFIQAITLAQGYSNNSLLKVDNKSNEQELLARRANWQAKFKTIILPSGIIGKQVTSIEPDSPLVMAGIKVEDVVVKINNAQINSNEHWYDISDALVGDVVYSITYQRKGVNANTNAVFTPLPVEQFENVSVSYSAVENPAGFLQRVIITRPKASLTDNKKRPAIFFLQGLSCSSIEVLPHRKSNYVRLIKEIVEHSNMVVMRVEKPGLGDSEGNCSQTDFDTELNGYEQAFQALARLPFVNQDKILIYGNSMGSAIAPYIANKYQANAVIADGTFFRSWFEHMLEIERRILAMKGKSQNEITKVMNEAYIPLYYGMLVEKKSYQELVSANTELAQYNYHGPLHMYGRPMSYYHQLQDFDFAGQWQKLTVPTYIRWGTNDWIMSEADNDMIVDVLKASGNNKVKLYKYPGLDHWSTIHDSATHSFLGKPGQWQKKISQQIVDWANEINR